MHKGPSRGSSNAHERQQRSVTSDVTDDSVQSDDVTNTDEQEILKWIVEESAKLKDILQLMASPKGTKEVPARSCLDIHLDHQQLSDGKT